MIEASPQQAAILDQPPGPLRIAAGAGTGKTTTIALRLAEAVSSGTAPEAALGITFTNKAAEELAHRLRQFLPDHAAAGREVQVTTYHGFAHDLLQEFGALVGVERDAKIITDGFARQMLSAAVEAAPTTRLDLTALGRRVAEAARLGGAAGDRLAAPEALLDDDGDEVAATRADLARVLLAYREMKARLGALDFGDLLVKAHQLVAQHPEVAARIASRYETVLLDEYQDTNPAQREILRAIFGPGSNVVAVGDAHQTIYEWRGASLENFARFPEHFRRADGSPAPSLPLTLNRRSGHRIVDVANRILGALGDEDSALTPVPDAGPGTVALGWFRDAVAEAQAIAAEARRLHDEHAVPWNDMAILFRANRQVGIVRDAFDIADIPIQVAAVGGLLGVPEVADLYAWLRLLGRPGDDAALIRLLTGSKFRLDLHDLQPLGDWVRRHPGSSLVDAVDGVADVAGLGDDARRRLSEVGELFRELIRTAQAASLVELCRLVLDRTGAWLDVEALADAPRLTARLNLYRFLDITERWSPLEGRPSLGAFLDYLDVLAEDDTAAELDTAVPSADDVVTLVTVHRAKGLEWPVVFLPGLASGVFPAHPQRYPDPYKYPDVLPDEAGLAPEPDPLPTDAGEREDLLRARHRDQELRTAYVAVTRAKDRLYGSGAFWYSLGRARKPSELYALFAEAGAATWHQEEGAGSPPDRLGFDVRTRGPDPDFEEGWPAILREAVADPEAPLRRAAAAGVEDSFSSTAEQLTLMLEGLPPPTAPPPGPEAAISASALVAYARCPRAYAYGYIDNLPTRPSGARRRGTELHRRIELFHRGKLTLGVEAEEPHEGPVAAGAFSAFRSSRFARQTPVHVEEQFRVVLDGTSVRGRIDAIFAHPDGSWELVDYKTGAPRSEPWHRVQLQVYAVAADQLGLVASTAGMKVTFAHIRSDIHEVTETADEAWMDEARKAIGSLVAGINNQAFHPAPGDKCRQCDFSHICPAGIEYLGSPAPPAASSR